jgi:hypothetical protein
MFLANRTQWDVSIELNSTVRFGPKSLYLTRTFYFHIAVGFAGFSPTRSFLSEMWNCVQEASIIQILSVTDK